VVRGLFGFGLVWFGCESGGWGVGDHHHTLTGSVTPINPSTLRHSMNHTNPSIHPIPTIHLIPIPMDPFQPPPSPGRVRSGQRSAPARSTPAVIPLAPAPASPQGAGPSLRWRRRRRGRGERGGCLCVLGVGLGSGYEWVLSITSGRRPPTKKRLGRAWHLVLEGFGGGLQSVSHLRPTPTTIAPTCQEAAPAASGVMSAPPGGQWWKPPRAARAAWLSAAAFCPPFLPWLLDCSS
jgi:hypothetical protein